VHVSLSCFPGRAFLVRSASGASVSFPRLSIRVLVNTDPDSQLISGSGNVEAGASLGMLYPSVYPSPSRASIISI